MRCYHRFVLSVALIFCTSSLAWADRTITDQIGRKVTIPDKVERVVVLQHQTLNLLVQMHQQDKIVGVLASWSKQLGAGFSRFMPSLTSLPMPGDLNRVNLESLLALQPQVVFVANYAPEEMINQIQQNGIPVIAISLRKDKETEKKQVNPHMEDEDWTYSEGLKEGIALIGEVMNSQQQANDLIHYAFIHRSLLAQRLQHIPENQRIRSYMANPALSTYGSGKYTGLLFQHAGAVNVAAKEIKGFSKVSIEQVLAWNPHVIFVQHRYPDVVKEIQQDPMWKNIDAVKNKRIYLMPEYAKAWGYPMPEALSLGELWMAKKLYPKEFTDIHMNKLVNDYYKRFYQVPYNLEQNDVKK